MAKFKEGGEIVARTTEGDIVRGTEVVVEKPDYATRAASVITGIACPLMFALGCDATEKTRYVDSGSGSLQEVKEVIARSK